MRELAAAIRRDHGPALRPRHGKREDNASHEQMLAEAGRLCRIGTICFYFRRRWGS